MDAFEIREKLLIGLRNVVLDTGEPLLTRVSEVDLHDIANTLTHFLPKGTQYQMVNIQTEILENIPNGSTMERLHYKDHSPVLPSDTTKHMKHKLFILLYTLFLYGEDLDKTIDEMFAFYRSFVIDELDLKEEVEASSASARSIKINDNEFVRISNTHDILVPTRKTIKQFNNLL